MQELTAVDLAAMKYYTFEQSTFAGRSDVIISATGYTGAGGFELYVKNKDAEHVWSEVMRAGAKADIKPIGLAARDTLRLEMGFCLYGNDIDENTSPIEAGLGWITKFSKDFINSTALKAEKEAGPTRKLIGFVMEDRGIPRQDYLIKNIGGEEIGKVTSGTQGPSIGKAVGLGYVKTEYAANDTEIFIEVRNRALRATVSRPPFYKP
jgi:aminomethyltransferase